MSQPATNLRILDDAGISRELDLVSELFHRINRIIPENQSLLKILPKTAVRDALSRASSLLNRTGNFFSIKTVSVPNVVLRKNLAGLRRPRARSLSVREKNHIHGTRCFSLALSSLALISGWLGATI